ncbi:MAG TPA: hypothetical protein VI431_00280 [Candidatus Acidoferrum sp.]
MKSILPPDLESKRLQIAKTHNRLVLSLAVGIFVAFLLVIGIAPHGPNGRYFILAGMVTAGILEGYGIYRIIEYDKQLCQQLGFICPRCRKPLYEPRGFINVTGRCPKCKNRVIS